MATKPFRLAILGGFQLCSASGSVLILPTKKMQAVLAYLALRSDQVHLRDKLAGLLWSERANEQARKSVRQTVYGLRKALGPSTPSALVIQGETLALNATAFEVDAVEFQRLVAEGTPDSLERAARLYGGDLLEGLGVDDASFEEWLLPERERLRELAVEALARLLQHHRAAREIQRAIQTAIRLLALDPLQEAVHRSLMSFYVAQGRRGTALKQYQDCVNILQRELGAEPEAETKQLYQALLTQTVPAVAKVEPSPRAEPRHQPPALLRAPFELPARETPLIGREGEWTRMRHVLDDAWQGHGHIVAVVGDAGIGKSRLLGELVFAAQQREGRVLMGRCHQSEQMLAFGPWVDALRSGDVAADRDLLEPLGPIRLAEVARLLPELEHESPPPPADHLRLFESLAQVIACLAARRPLAVALEDVHWADEMSLRLLAFVARRVRALPVVMAVTARADELVVAPVLRGVLEELANERHFVHLQLSPLSKAATGALVRALARTGRATRAGPSFEEQVWSASEGNPFMVVEIMRAVAQGSAPRTRSALPLPERVREVIGFRLERLAERGRQLLPVAAVIGREFEFALLRRAAAVSDHEAAEGLEELVRRRVLQGVGERFGFTHDHIREVVYERLLAPRRKLLHAHVACAMEELYASDLEPHYAALARHCRDGELWDRAARYFRSAGAQALTRSAYREAVACFEEALAALGRVPSDPATLEQAIDIRFDLRIALYPLGKVKAGMEHIRHAERLATALGDQRRLGWISGYMSNALMIAGQPREGRAAAQRARSAAVTVADVPLRVAADYYWATASYFLGDYGPAETVYRQVLKSLEDEHRDERWPLAGVTAVLARAQLACVLAERGAFAEAITWGEEGIRIAETLEHSYSLVLGCWDLAYVHTVRGELERARTLLERGLALSRAASVSLLSPTVMWSLGSVYVAGGRGGEGMALLREGLAAAESLGGTLHILGTLRLGEACLLTGQLAEAQRLAQRALTVVRERGQRGWEAYALHLLGQIASHPDQRDGEPATGFFQQALALAQQLGMRPLVARCRLGLGHCYRNGAEPERAQEHLDAALALFRALEMPSPP